MAGEEPKRALSVDMMFQLVALGGAVVVFGVGAPAYTWWLFANLDPVDVRCGALDPDAYALDYRLHGCEADLGVVAIERKGVITSAVYLPLRAPGSRERPVVVIRTTERAVIEWARDLEAEPPSEVLEWAGPRDFRAVRSLGERWRTDISDQELREQLGMSDGPLIVVDEEGRQGQMWALLGSLWVGLALSVGGLVWLLLIWRRRRARARESEA